MSVGVSELLPVPSLECGWISWTQVDKFAFFIIFLDGFRYEEIQFMVGVDDGDGFGKLDFG